MVRFQAKRIVTSLIESSTDGNVKVEIGGINIHPVTSSLRIKSLSVLVKDPETESYKKANIDNAYLDVASLWNFLTGGTLVIEKLETEGVDLFIYNNHTSDTTSQAFSLNEILQNIKRDAIRFDIQDIVFRDVNLILSKDTLNTPTEIKHFYVHMQNLNFSADSTEKKKPKIEFGLPKQVITLPSKLSIGFDSLSFTTRDNSIQFLKLKLNSPPSETTHVINIESDKVRVSDFSFESLFNTGKIRIDSVFLGKSKVSVDWRIAHSGKNKQARKGSINTLPYVDINHVLFKELASDVTIRSDSVENYFRIENGSLLINDFTHNPDSSRVISSPSYNLLIAKYSTFLSDSSKSISFDTIQIQKQSLSLLNFEYKLREQMKPLIQTPRLELKEVDWYEFLINRKLVAEELLISAPTIVTTIKPGKVVNSRPLDTFQVIEVLNTYFIVNLLSVKDAKAIVAIPDRNMNVTLNGYSTSINVSDLINSGNVNEGLDAIRFLAFRNIQLTNPDFNVQVGNFYFSNRMITVGIVDFQNTADLKFQLRGLKTDKFSWSETLNTLHVDGLGWKNIKAEIKGSEQRKAHADTDKENNIPHITVTQLVGGTADILFTKNDLNLVTSLLSLNLESLSFSDSVIFTGLDVQGSSLKLATPLNDVRVGKYSFTDHGGEIHDIWFNRNTSEYVNLMAGKLSLKANLPDFLRQRYLVNELLLENFHARFNRNDSIQSLDLDVYGRLVGNNLYYDNKRITLGSLYLHAGPFVLDTEKLVEENEPAEEEDLTSKRKRLKSDINSRMKNEKTLKSFGYSSVGIKATHTKSDTAELLTKRIHLGSKNGGLKAYLSNINFNLADSAKKVTANFNKVEFEEVDFTTDKLIAWMKQGSLDNFVLNSDRTKNIWNVIEDNYHTASIHTAQASVNVNDNVIRIGGLDYHPQTASAMVKQFEFRPVKNRQQFLEESFYQTNYMAVQIDAISLSRLNTLRLLKDTVIHFENIHVSDPNLEIGRDKTRPFLAKSIKPLPTNAFQKLKVRFKVDTLGVADGKINYTEKSKITGKEGTIGFTELNALVRNIKNIELQNNDSLYIRATTRFMDSARVRLRVKESYRDTLGGFLMATDVSPFHTSILNKALVPMVSVDFKSGFVDTLHMRAIGREYLSLGSMKFLYRDLKVEFLDKEDTSRHSIKNQLLKFAANTFVIRPNNQNRIGEVYFERDRNRAVFQYWVKMILSGVTTSVGAKSNKKQIRKYLKSLNQKRLPPIKGDFEL